MERSLSQSSASSLSLFLAVVMLSVLLAGCAAETDSAGEALSSSSSESIVASSAQSESSAMAAGAYEDGTYAATGNYVSPAGPEEMDISLTLEDGVITDATFVGKAEHPTSVKMQTNFSEGFAAEVVGRPIDELSLTVVNGSSLAPKGFMDAVSKIQAEAAAS